MSGVCPVHDGYVSSMSFVQSLQCRGRRAHAIIMLMLTPSDVPVDAGRFACQPGPLQRAAAWCWPPGAPIDVLPRQAAVTGCRSGRWRLPKLQQQASALAWLWSCKVHALCKEDVSRQTARRGQACPAETSAARPAALHVPSTVLVMHWHPG